MRKVLFESGIYVGREGKGICCRTRHKTALCSECRIGYNHDNPNDIIPVQPVLSASEILGPYRSQQIFSGLYREMDGTIRCADCGEIYTPPSTNRNLSVSCPPSQPSHYSKGVQPVRNAAAVKTNLSDIEVRDLIELALRDVEPSATLISVWQGKGEILYTLNGDHYTRSFTIKDDISIVFGNPVQVVEEKTYVPVTASVAARVSNSPVTNRSARPLPDTWAMSASEHAKNQPPKSIYSTPTPKVSGKARPLPDAWGMNKKGEG